MNTDELKKMLFPPHQDPLKFFLDEVNLQQALEHLLIHIGDSWLDNYWRMHNKMGGPFSMKLIGPNDIILLGYHVGILKDHLDNSEFAKILMKIRASGLSGSEQSGFQLADSISEIECAAALANSGQEHIKIDYETGKIGNSKTRDSDIFLSNEKIYVEIKRHDSSRQSSSVRFMEESKEIFSKENSFGKHTDFIVQKGDWKKMEKSANSERGATAAIFDPKSGDKMIHEVNDLIGDAKKKFLDDQKAIVVIDGFIGKMVNNGIIAARKHLISNPSSPVKAIIVKSKRIWGQSDVSTIIIVTKENKDNAPRLLSEIVWPFGKIFTIQD